MMVMREGKVKIVVLGGGGAGCHVLGVGYWVLGVGCCVLRIVSWVLRGWAIVSYCP